MSALAAEVEAVEVEDMEVGLDYWLPGDSNCSKCNCSKRERVLTPCLYCPANKYGDYILFWALYDCQGVDLNGSVNCLPEDSSETPCLIIWF